MATHQQFGHLAAAPLAWALGLFSWRQVFVAIGMASPVLAALTWFFVRSKPEDFGHASVRVMEGLEDHAPNDAHWLHGVNRSTTV